MDSKKALARVRLHNKLRWIGIPLFCGGIAALVTAIWLFHGDRAGWHPILWSVGATFTGLATFGNHHDNSIAWMLLCEKDALDDALCKELEDELRHDKAGTLAHQPAPYLAAFVTVLALFFQFMANYRISQVL